MLLHLLRSLSLCWCLLIHSHTTKIVDVWMYHPVLNWVALTSPVSSLVGWWVLLKYRPEDLLPIWIAAPGGTRGLCALVDFLDGRCIHWRGVLNSVVMGGDIEVEEMDWGAAVDGDEGDIIPELTPRIRQYLLSFLNKDPPPPPGDGAPPTPPVPDKPNPFLGSTTDGRGGDVRREDWGAPKPGLGGGLLERLAARAGFSAPKLDASLVKSAVSGSSVMSRSVHNTLSPPLSPPLSPSVPNDAPGLMFNSKDQPSPTTGKLPLGQCNNTSSLPIAETADNNEVALLTDADVVAFNSHTGMSSSYLSNTENKTDAALAQQQHWPSQEASAYYPEFSNQAKSLDAYPGNQQEDHPMSDFSEPADRKHPTVDLTSEQKLSNSGICNENSPFSVGELPLVSVGQPCENDYNWRKYGQKQVKGSQCPRSYYKCTHQNCQAKKKVERSHEGHVTKIIYKGNHNHRPPSVNHEASVTSSNPNGDMWNDAPKRQVMLPIALNGTGNQEWSDRVGASPNVPKTTEFCDPSMSVSMQYVPCFESSSAIDSLSTPPNQDGGEEKEYGAHGNGFLGVDGGDEMPESKRRKLDASVVETSSSRIVHTRVVVQTTSEVDILDDGYRWRKYGQKVVKGNPNPRSYYKCTSAGCNVRKHVERASHDPTSVITSYEGRHNHEVPTARNSSHSNTGPSGSSQSHNAQRRSDRQHFPIFDTTAALGMFDMPPPGIEQFIPSAAISLGLSQPSFTSVTLLGLVPELLQQAHAYLLQEPGYVIPNGVEEEQMTNPSLPILNEGLVHQQILGRLGPQL